MSRRSPSFHAFPGPLLRCLLAFCFVGVLASDLSAGGGCITMDVSASTSAYSPIAAYNHTVNFPNELLVVHVLVHGTGGPSTVTYNGISMTTLGYVVDSAARIREFWYLTYPPVGNFTVVANNPNGSAGMSIISFGYLGVYLPNPIGASNFTGDLYGSNPSASLTTGTKDSFIATSLGCDTSAVITAVAPNNARVVENSGSSFAAGDMDTDGPGVYSPSYLLDITSLSGMQMVELNAACALFTPTPTFTPTRTRTITPTVTKTPTQTTTKTTTLTVTQTVTPTSTPSQTQTDTPTATGTDTATATQTDTQTATQTDTPTATQTDTPTATRTDTPTASPTLTPTAIGTYTSTKTLTETPSGTPSATPTVTLTASPTATATRSFSPSATLTATESCTASATASSTPTATVTTTPSLTRTTTSSPTASASATASFTVTRSATATFAPSFTPTRTATATATPTGVPTASPTPAWSSPTYTPATAVPTLAPVFQRDEPLFLGANVFRPAQGGVLDIGFKAGADDHVTIKIFNLAGEFVCPAAEMDVKNGLSYAATWAGTNADGRTVSSGVYFVLATGPHTRWMKKVVVLK